jgi:hypothetical protein
LIEQVCQQMAFHSFVFKRAQLGFVADFAMDEMK